jgi:hypothetical protein
MVYDREGRKLWIVEDTGKNKPVGSWEEVEKRPRRADLPDWWLVAKDIAWRPPLPELLVPELHMAGAGYSGRSLLSMHPDELRTALAATPDSGGSGSGAGGTGSKLGCGGKCQEQYDTSNGRYVGSGGGTGGAGRTREGGGRTAKTPTPPGPRARTEIAPPSHHKAAGTDKTPPPPKWPDTDPPPPPGVDLEKNMREAEAHRGDLFWLKDQVNSGKPWDYKNVQGVNESERIEDFGNFNYGATGAALGVPDWMLYAAAGDKQLKDHPNDPEQTTSRWSYPYGDDPRDAEMIRRGIEYYRKWKMRITKE